VLSACVLECAGTPALLHDLSLQYRREPILDIQSIDLEAINRAHKCLGFAMRRCSGAVARTRRTFAGSGRCPTLHQNVARSALEVRCVLASLWNEVHSNPVYEFQSAPCFRISKASTFAPSAENNSSLLFVWRFLAIDINQSKHCTVDPVVGGSVRANPQ